MIEAKHLKKQYGRKMVLNDINFHVGEKEIVGFLGLNGAGKSTVMNILTGYISATEGEVLIDGVNLLENPIGVKAKIGYLPEHPPLYLDMTVDEQLDFVYRVRGLQFEKEKHIQEICELAHIADVRKRAIRNLSKGYRQRVGLAQALVGSPHILILDEPTVGLDPQQIIDIRNVIKELREKHTVIMSSHILPEVSSVCDRVLVINNGRIVADDKADRLSRSIIGGNRLVARIIGEEKKATKAIRGIAGVTGCEAKGCAEARAFDYVIDTEPQVDVREELFRKLADLDLPLILLKPLDVTLEDIFLQLTRDTVPSGNEVKA